MYHVLPCYWDRYSYASFAKEMSARFVRNTTKLENYSIHPKNGVSLHFQFYLKIHMYVSWNYNVLDLRLLTLSSVSVLFIYGFINLYSL